MIYSSTCPHCGALLSPAEPCDCTGALIGAAMLLTEGAAEQWDPPKSHAPGILKKETAPSAANTEDGKETTQDR